MASSAPRLALRSNFSSFSIRLRRHHSTRPVVVGAACWRAAGRRRAGRHKSCWRASAAGAPAALRIREGVRPHPAAEHRREACELVEQKGCFRRCAALLSMASCAELRLRPGAVGPPQQRSEEDTHAGQWPGARGGTRDKGRRRSHLELHTAAHQHREAAHPPTACCKAPQLEAQRSMKPPQQQQMRLPSA